jgi:hypothetical protein
MRLVAGGAADKSKVPSQPENTAMNQSNRVSSSLRVAGLGTALALAVAVMPAIAAEQSTQPQDQAPAATGALTQRTAQSHPSDANVATQTLDTVVIGGAVAHPGDDAWADNDDSLPSLPVAPKNDR